MNVPLGRILGSINGSSYRSSLFSAVPSSDISNDRNDNLEARCFCSTTLLRELVFTYSLDMTLHAFSLSSFELGVVGLWATFSCSAEFEDRGGSISTMKSSFA